VKLVHYVNHEATVTRCYYDSSLWHARPLLMKVDIDQPVTCFACLALSPVIHRWKEKGVEE
jgi:hypothetical protein